MVVYRWFLGAVIGATAVSATNDLQLFSRLLKEQKPGTPAYNCHDNCGQAAIRKGNCADVCHDDTFLSDYKACLQCSGPDNQDIWKYYGETLKTDASPCGLPSKPLPGNQPGAGPATPGASTATSASEATSPAATGTAGGPTETEATTTAEYSTTAEASTTVVTPIATETQITTKAGSTTETPETTQASDTTQYPVTTEVPTTTGVVPVPIGTETVPGGTTKSAGETGSKKSTTSKSFITSTPTPTDTGAGGDHGATTTSGRVIVTNAANDLGDGLIGPYGALALGALYAAAL
ncbi:hypothetical protein GGR52DRAFT_540778 [Hypoxylon sp. FL1284]|nr:hypothetical protein GGR52DRAFT_540778 [Hypoxylon sp. FL1284]